LSFATKVPEGEDEWLDIAREFYKQWNFPNCIGAVDGKLVHVQRPFEGGSRYFNYKKTYSVNLMAVCDAHLRFIYVNIGAQGSANDAAVFNATSFAKKLADPRNPLSIPGDADIPGTNVKLPFMLVGDEAFPMKTYLMKPFNNRGMAPSERIFNYRLSRCRRTIENSFGVLANRFRIYHHAVQLSPSKVTDFVLATCALHNMLISKRMENEADAENVDSSEDENDQVYRTDVTHAPRTMGMRYNANVKGIRDTLASYFVGLGQLSWQWKHGNV
jgi:DDE superfamily endonuclease